MKYYGTCVYEEGFGPVFKDSLKHVECVNAMSKLDATLSLLHLPHVVKLEGEVLAEDEMNAMYNKDGSLAAGLN